MINEDWQDALAQPDQRRFGFGHAVVVSGIDHRQLRNGLDRGILSVGHKLESVSRWTFSLRDCVHLIVVAELTQGLWVPVGQADAIGREIARATELIAVEATLASELQKSGSKDVPQSVFLVWSENGEARVVRQTQGGDTAREGFFDLDDRPVEVDGLRPYIGLHGYRLLTRLATGLQAALAE